MQQLEDDVTRLASLAPETRLAGGSLVPFTKLSGLIHRLIDTAESVVDAANDASGATDSRFFVFVERAESWCDSLNDFIPPGKAAALVAAGTLHNNSTTSGADEKPQTTPLIIIAHQARLRTFGAARDAYRRGQQWGMCLRYAERVDAVNRAMMAFYKAFSGDNAAAHLRASIAAVTRSTLSVGGLQSKLDRHNTALEQTQAAADLIGPLVKELSAAHGAKVAEGTASAAELDQLRAELAGLGALRVAALYSTAAELEHLDRPSDALPLLRQALHAATVESPLAPGHPLVAKIEAALAGFESDRSTSVASSVLAGARTGRVTTAAARGGGTGRTVSSSRKSSGTRQRRPDSLTRRSGNTVEKEAPGSARKPPPSVPGLAPLSNAVQPPRTADPSLSARTPHVPQPPAPRTTTAPAPGGAPANGAGFRRPLPPQLSASTVMRGATFSSGADTAQPSAKTAFDGADGSGGGEQTFVPPPANARPLFPNAAGRPPVGGGGGGSGGGRQANVSSSQQPVTVVAHLDDSVITPADVQPMSTINVSRAAGAASAGASPMSAASRATPAAAGTVGGSRPGTKGTTTSQSQRGGKNATNKSATTGAMAVVETMRDRELQLKQKYALWVAQTSVPIQALFRRRCRAALVIQCGWRCARARLEAFNRRQVLFHFYHQLQKAAAAAVLAKYRTFVAKRDARARIVAIREHRAKVAAREHVERAAVLVIQRALAAYVVKCRREAELMRLLHLEQAAKLKQYDTAAVMVQRWWPLAKEQRAYWRRRNVELAEVRRVEAERLRNHNAATNISRVYRGHLARHYAREFREKERERKRKLQLAIRGSIDAIRIFLKEVRARKERLLLERDLELRRRDTAAAKIQQSWGRSLQREHMHLVAKRGRAVKAAAASIQRCYRRFRARRDLRVLRAVSRTQALIRVEREWKQERAARKVQCAWRQNRARKCVRAVKASYGRKLLLATWLLQRVGRGFGARQEEGMDHALRVQLIEFAMREAFRKRERLAAMIQGACRASLSVAEAIARKEAVEAEELLIVRRTRREMFEDVKATKIQAVARGKLGRNRARDHAELLRSCESMILTATIRLQCFIRKTLARLALHQRQVTAWKLRKKRELMAEVASELFASRVDELSRLEHASRSALEAKERGRTLVLVAKARRIGWPVSGLLLDAATGPAETPDLGGGADDDADGYDTDRRRLSFADAQAAPPHQKQLVPAPPSRAASDAPPPLSRQETLELRESRDRNALLRHEVRTFVSIFVELQRLLPELASATPGGDSDAAYPVASSCPYDDDMDDDEAAAAEADDREGDGAAVASRASDRATTNTADHDASSAPHPYSMYDNNGSADGLPRTAGSIPHGEDLDDLLAAPPPAQQPSHSGDTRSDSAAAAAAPSAAGARRAAHMQDPYDAYYGIQGTYGADEEDEEDDSDSDGLYD